MKKIPVIKKNTFLKKLFIKLCRKIGFEIIDQSNFYIPTKNTYLNQNLNIINKKNITLPLGEIKITRKVKSFLIIFRSFTNENKQLSQNKKRIFEKDKKEYTFRSLQSVCNNIKFAKKELKNVKFFLKIIDDNSKTEVISKLKKIVKKSRINFEFSNLDINKYKSKMKFKNNKRMLAHNSHIFESKLYAKNSNFDLIYFIEDDYIHTSNAFLEMIYSYEKFSTLIKKDVILCAADYPYLYNKFEPTKVMAGYKKHWRKIDESLCTYLISKKILIENWKNYEKMYLNTFDPYEKPLHAIYKKYPCFSPMPSLALHMTNVNSIYGLSPLVDWLKIWNDNKS